MNEILLDLRMIIAEALRDPRHLEKDELARK